MNDAGAKFDDRDGEGPAGLRGEEETAAQPQGDKYAPDSFATDALDETHLLLAYAASAGINIEPEVSEAIARARAANERHSWNADIEAKFWPAKSKLSQSVKPVTVDSLAAGKFGAAAIATRRYFLSTVILAAIIVPISIVMFINTAVSNDVRDLLKENDAAAIAVHEQLVNYQSALEQSTRIPRQPADQKGNSGNSPGVSEALLSPNLIEKLAQFARVSRQLFAESRVLNMFILNSAQEPWWASIGKDSTGKDITRANLELDVRAGDRAGDGFPSIITQGFEKLATYQDIRSFARQTQQMNLILYGAITAYVLPVAYALLGACAFALRNMAAQTGTKTYQPSYSNRARLIIALIAGTVVGLFNNFTQGVSVSPLAVAFLVGYAVEVFFSFLDAFVHTFESVRNPRALGASATA
ncbi:MAG: hypothetical protein JO320_14925 [Alphaproteobacteria bacterium]|nr:hypothetical protein [Alphaproteobacteria bacterium]MBV9376328.1 hypothetical protein [Alphaproteobacteria bacterium]